MMALKTWFKQVGGALIACLLLAFVAGPIIDTAVCANDGDRATAQSHELVVQTTSADHQDKDHDGGSDMCIHGHCHHASPFVGAEVAYTNLRNPLARHTAPQSRGLPPSSAQDRLEEPPRA